MSIVFKTIPQDDQTVTPFKVFKSWEYTDTSANRFSNLFSASIYLGTAIKPNPDNYTGDLMSVDFDVESDTNDASRLLNTHLQNVPAGVLWYALKHKYFNDYNDFISFAGNAEALNLNTNSTEWEGLTFTQSTASLNKSYNYIEDKTNPSSSYRLPSIASVISIPQLKFGEEIKPGSFELIVTTSYDNLNYKLYDDSKGNIKFDYYDALPSPDLNSRILYLGFNESEYEKISINNKSNLRYPTNIDFYNVNIVTSSIINNVTANSIPYDLTNGLSAKFSSSYIRIDGTPSYFNPRTEDDYTVCFYVTLNSLPAAGKKMYLVTKRGLSRDYARLSNGRFIADNVWNLNEDKFPYNIYVDDVGIVHAEISDGTTKIELQSIAAAIPGNIKHVALTKNVNTYTLYIDGYIDSQTLNNSLVNITNKSDIFIGSFATKENNLNTPNEYLNGIIDEFQIYNTAITDLDLVNLINGNLLSEQAVGKIFYKEGMVVLNTVNSLIQTKYVFNNSGYLTTIPFSSTLYNNSVNTIQHSGVHPSTTTLPFSNLNSTGSFNTMTMRWNSTVTLYENEILCRIREDEFNVTLNPTILKDKENSYIPKDFTFDDEFNPYITTIGLYNEKAELLAIGKLANPIKKRPDVDLNIIIRFDQ